MKSRNPLFEIKYMEPASSIRENYVNHLTLILPQITGVSSILRVERVSSAYNQVCKESHSKFAVYCQGGGSIPYALYDYHTPNAKEVVSIIHEELLRVLNHWWRGESWDYSEKALACKLFT